MAKNDKKERVRPEVRLTILDAMTVKPYYVALGWSIDDLAELISAKRGCKISQARKYLEKVRGRDNWNGEREIHLEAVNIHAKAAVATDQARFISTLEMQMAMTLVKQGFEEVQVTQVQSRNEALRTLKLGYDMAWRATGQPDRVSQILPTQPIEQTQQRSALYAGMGADEALALFEQRLQEFRQSRMVDEDGKPLQIAPYAPTVQQVIPEDTDTVLPGSELSDEEENTE